VRRPGRSLVVAALLIVTALGLTSFAAHLALAYHYRAARRALDRYHYARAGKHLLPLLRLRPDSPDVMMLAARTARGVGEMDRAEEFLDRYERLRGADDDLVFERLLLRLDRGEGDHDEALQRLCRARIDAGGPDAPRIYEAVIRHYLRVYRLLDAEQWVNRWLAESPDNVRALLFQASLLETRLQSSEACAVFRRVLDLDPENDEARLRLCTRLLSLAQADEALPHLLYLRREQPDDPVVGVRLAQCLAILDRSPEAERLLDEVIAAHPRHAPALAERGRMAVRQRQEQEAEPWLRRAVELEPSDYESRHQLHLCLVKNGKLDEAREQLQVLKRVEADLRRLQDIMSRDMQRSPHDPELHYELGQIALRAGAYRDALRWFQSALREDANHAPSHRALANYYHRMGNTAQATRHRNLAQQGSRKER
jgi:predicted Zn-dependent protease